MQTLTTHPILCLKQSDDIFHSNCIIITSQSSTQIFLTGEDLKALVLKLLAAQFLALHRPFFLVLHFAWAFLCSFERAILCRIHPALEQHAKLRLTASSLDVSPLRLPRPPPNDDPIDPARATMMAAALLRFHFNYVW